MGQHHDGIRWTLFCIILTATSRYGCLQFEFLIGQQRLPVSQNTLLTSVVDLWISGIARYARSRRNLETSFLLNDSIGVLFVQLWLRIAVRIVIRFMGFHQKWKQQLNFTYAKRLETKSTWALYSTYKNVEKKFTWIWQWWLDKNRNEYKRHHCFEV